MKKLMLVFVAMLIGAPVMAADDAARKAQCEAWAAEDGLKDKEAQEYIQYCMEESKNSFEPAEEAAKGNN